MELKSRSALSRNLPAVRFGVQRAASSPACCAGTEHCVRGAVPHQLDRFCDTQGLPWIFFFVFFSSGD